MPAVVHAENRKREPSPVENPETTVATLCQIRPIPARLDEGNLKRRRGMDQQERGAVESVVRTVGAKPPPGGFCHNPRKVSDLPKFVTWFGQPDGRILVCNDRGGQVGDLRLCASHFRASAELENAHAEPPLSFACASVCLPAVPSALPKASQPNP
eukprot:scaffold843_cov255-Pinguiococcus_pyrenoidosus.AAC.10